MFSLCFASTLQEEIEIATAAHRGTTTEKNVDANIDLHTLGIFGALATFHVKRMISLWGSVCVCVLIQKIIDFSYIIYLYLLLYIENESWVIVFIVVKIIKVRLDDKEEAKVVTTQWKYF